MEFPLPFDTITFAGEFSGVDTGIITTTTPTTVLGIFMKQSGIASETEVLCGTELVGKNYDRDYRSLDMAFLCNDTLSVNKTGGGDSAFILVNYIERDYNFSTRPIDNLTIMAGFFLFILTFAVWLKVFRFKNAKNDL